MPSLPSLRFCEETIKTKYALEASFLALAQRLKRIKEEMLYEDQWADFGAFLMELKMSETMANRLIQIYEVFVVQFKCAPARLGEAGGWSSLADILPVVKSKKDADLWLDKAINLTRTDLRRELKEEKTGKPMASCKHRSVYYLRICEDCGLRERVYINDDGAVTNEKDEE